MTPARSAREDDPPRPPSDGSFAALWTAARSAWPDFDVAAEDFARYLARHAGDGALRSPERAGDLYLACSCARGLPRALDAFERILQASVARAVARIDRSRSFADLVTQDLRSRLLMGDPPKIVDYAGRAPLASWLKTAAVRSALNLMRAKGDQRHDSLPSGLIAEGEPELALVRAKYRPEFEDALRTALSSLPERDRAVLCSSVRDGRSIDEIAEMHGVGRSTAARWLIAARERLTAETRRTLQERLGLTPSELDSVAAAVRSEVDVSIVRLLG